MPSFLLIQTASIGDVILITPVMEKLHHQFTDAFIDVMLKKGTESLFENHPFIRRIYTWDKSKKKYRHLVGILSQVRKLKYDYVINFQRFASTGLFTCISGAKNTSGFDKNPFSFCFTQKVKHQIYPESQIHETERNLKLVEGICGKRSFAPKLYPSENDFETAHQVAGDKGEKYVCIAPASLWFTKQLPSDKWIRLISELKNVPIVYLLGSKTDQELCRFIMKNAEHPRVVNLAGQLTMLQSAALMKGSLMNWVNDSSPMHLASTVDAPVAAVFCSTLPAFGFGPLSSHSHIIEIEEPLPCRPCGLHGRTECPLKHFECANNIKISQLLSVLSDE